MPRASRWCRYLVHVHRELPTVLQLRVWACCVECIACERWKERAVFIKIGVYKLKKKWFMYRILLNIAHHPRLYYVQLLCVRAGVPKLMYCTCMFILCHTLICLIPCCFVLVLVLLSVNYCHTCTNVYIHMPTCTRTCSMHTHTHTLHTDSHTVTPLPTFNTHTRTHILHTTDSHTPLTTYMYTHTHHTHREVCQKLEEEVVCIESQWLPLLL